MLDCDDKFLRGHAAAEALQSCGNRVQSLADDFGLWFGSVGACSEGCWEKVDKDRRANLVVFEGAAPDAARAHAAGPAQREDARDESRRGG